MKKLIVGVLLGLASLAAQATDIHIVGAFADSEWFGQNIYVAMRPSSFSYDVTYTRNANNDGIASLASATVNIGGTVYQTGAIEWSPTLNGPSLGLVGGGNGALSLGSNGHPDMVLAWDYRTSDVILWLAVGQYGLDEVARAFGKAASVTVTNDVPVPGSLALLGIGAVGLIAARRKHSDFIPA